MDFLKLASKRHSVRNFKPDMPHRENIERIIEAARLAPSAVNLQPWHFFICESDKAKDAIRRCYQRDWFMTAPLYIIVCADPESGWHRPEDGKIHSDIDAAIATEHICLAAASEGLGTCWVCRFDPQQVINELAIPSPLQPVALIPVGIPADNATRPTTRKPLKEIVTHI